MLDIEFNVVMTLLLICATGSTVLTEGLKKLLPNGKPNILVAISSVITSISVCLIYALTDGTEINASYIFFMVVMVLLTWLASMVGYDKIKQTLEQIKKFD